MELDITTNIFILKINEMTLYGEYNMTGYIIVNNYTNFKKYPKIDFNEIQKEIDVKKNYIIIKYL
jgi:hypothetical protein